MITSAFKAIVAPHIEFNGCEFYMAEGAGGGGAGGDGGPDLIFHNILGVNRHRFIRFVGVSKKTSGAAGTVAIPMDPWKLNQQMMVHPPSQWVLGFWQVQYTR